MCLYCVSVIHISIYWYTHQYIMQYISLKRTHWLKKYKNLASFPNLNSKNKTTKGAAYPKCIMWNNKHIQKCKFTSNFSDLVIYHIRPIYNGKTLRYCYEESKFARSWVFCKQTAEPKEKACSGEASRIGEYQRIDSCYWGLRHQVIHTDKSFGPQSTVLRTRSFTFKTYSLHSSETGLLER